MDSFSHLKALCHGEVYKELTITEAYLDYNIDGTDVCTATIYDPCFAMRKCTQFHCIRMYSVESFSPPPATSCNHIQLKGGSIGSEEW